MDITLIAATGQHLFRPLLYQVATGILSPGDIAPSTREILRRQHNVTVLLGTVIELDLNAKVITSEVGSVQSFTGYDTLVLAAGAMTSYCGHDEYAGFAPGMKSIDDALELRGRILGAFELVERATDPVEQERLLTFAIVGGDPTGVELAGQVSERRPGRDPRWPVMRPTIRARLDRRSAPGGPGAAHAPAPFRYFDKGSMAAFSRTSAVVAVGKLRFSGRLAWLMWLGLHLFYLLGNRHRLSMLLHWAFSFVSHRRTDRVVTERQGLARQAQLSLPVAGQPAAESTAPAESARRRRRGLRRWSDESGRCGGELRCGASAP